MRILSFCIHRLFGGSGEHFTGGSLLLNKHQISAVRTLAGPAIAYTSHSLDRKSKPAFFKESQDQCVSGIINLKNAYTTSSE